MNTKVLCGWLIGSLALAGAAMGQGSVIAYDEAGNYTPETFVHGANLGFGFGAWDFWNEPATLGDSTAGGGGDINSTNGYSFRFMGDGEGGWCNGRRNFDGALQEGDVLSFTFTYNWDGGGRGVDIFSESGQFANLIDVSPGDTFQVNGETISTEWSPGAVVAVEITQQADGIQLHLTRETNGTENLNYTTNILYPEPATGVSMYCGGYTCDPGDNVNYAIFMNNLQIVGQERIRLTFTSGTWDPQEVGDYEFVLAREGAVGDEIVLTSSNPDAVTVPAGVTFVSNSVAFDVTVVSLTNGPATVVASNEATGVWTDYTITPVPPTLAIGGPWELFIVPQPVQYTLTRTGAVGDNVSLTSSDPSVLAVPPMAAFAAGETETTFTATSMAYGVATILASNAAAQATFDVTVSAPALTLSGPATVWSGDDKVFIVTRNSAAAVGDTVQLSSSSPNVLPVPASVAFAPGELRAYFTATANESGTTVLSADNDEVEPTTLDVAVRDMPSVLAHDEAGNYTPETFANGANEGTGFGAWELWNLPADLGDSTAGGGGDINSGNGYSFRFMGDGAGGWCNGKRNFDGALQEGDVLSFTFTYNWDGGGRGVDIFSESGQFANLIDVSPGDTFQVNGETISTEWSPGAVVAVEITQQADGIQLYLTRTVDGAVNLAYVTNIVHGEAATGVSMYCGGYTCEPEDNVNYAIFMNNLQIAGEGRLSLVFSQATWNPSAVGVYPFELTRVGPVGDNLVLTSDNEAAVTVPPSISFDPEALTVQFSVTVVSLTEGDATIVASNADTGVWAEYTVRPQLPTLTFTAGTWDPATTGDYEFELTRGGSTVDDVIVLTSDNEAAVTVPPSISFDPGASTVRFFVTVVSLSAGEATIVASNEASGAWADYTIRPQQPTEGPSIGPITFDVGTGDFSFAIPDGYDLGTVWGADFVPNAEQDWDWAALVLDTDYTVEAGTGVVTILGDAAARRIIRIGWLPK